MTLRILQLFSVRIKVMKTYNVEFYLVDTTILTSGYIIEMSRQLKRDSDSCGDVRDDWPAHWTHCLFPRLLPIEFKSNSAWSLPCVSLRSTENVATTNKLQKYISVVITNIYLVTFQKIINENIIGYSNSVNMSSEITNKPIGLKLRVLHIVRLAIAAIARIFFNLYYGTEGEKLPLISDEILKLPAVEVAMKIRKKEVWMIFYETKSRYFDI